MCVQAASSKMYCKWQKNNNGSEINNGDRETLLVAVKQQLVGGGIRHGAGLIVHWVRQGSSSQRMLPSIVLDGHKVRVAVRRQSNRTVRVSTVEIREAWAPGVAVVATERHGIRARDGAGI